MTIKQRQYFQNVSQQKKIAVFPCQKEKSSEGANEKLLESGGWRKKQWDANANQSDATVHSGSQAAQLSPTGCKVRRKTEDERVCPSEQRLEGKLTEGDNDPLLILANSAELVSESEDSLGIAYTNPQDHQVLDSIMGAQHLQENVNDVMATDCDKNCDNQDEIPIIVNERNEKDGSHHQGRMPRLSHIRRQARLTGQSLGQQSIKEGTPRCLQGSKTRLTQIRRQARLGNHVPPQEDIARCSHGKFLGGITGLSQILCQARSKNNCLLQEGTEENMCRHHVDCQFHQDQRKEDGAVEQGANLQSCQVIGASSSPCSVDAENVDKIMYEKGRLRLSQLRRKARSRNADLIALENAGLLDKRNEKFNMGVRSGCFG